VIIYLYIKQHNITGLKYFGKTESKDPYSYTGSGKFWLRHCKKHGFDFTTSHVWQFTSQEECSAFAVLFSSENNIVTGLPKGSKQPARTDEYRAKLSKAAVGRPSKLKGRTYEEIHGAEKAREMRQKRTESNIARGPRSKETRQKISIGHVKFHESHYNNSKLI
jgi:hypothetical protein